MAMRHKKTIQKYMYNVKHLLKPETFACLSVLFIWDIYNQNKQRSLKHTGSQYDFIGVRQKGLQK